MDEPRRIATRQRRLRQVGPHGSARFLCKRNAQNCASKECLVEDGRARAILNDVAYLAGQFNIHAYQEDRGKGLAMAWFAADMPPTMSCWYWWSTANIYLTNRSLLLRFARHILS